MRSAKRAQSLRHHGRVADGVQCGGAQTGVFPQLEAMLIEVCVRSVGGSSLLAADHRRMTIPLVERAASSHVRAGLRVRGSVVRCT
jgi:hypothetical protein